MVVIAFPAIMPVIGTICEGINLTEPDRIKIDNVKIAEEEMAMSEIFKEFGILLLRLWAFHDALKTMTATITKVTIVLFTLNRYVNTYPTAIS